MFHSDSFIAIRYHAWWPGGDDPFYLSNVEENTQRIRYYDIHAVPAFYLDGASAPTSDLPLTQREQEESPLEITLEPSYGTIKAGIYASGAITQADLVTRFVLTESDIHFEVLYGEPWHDQTMRDVFPDTSGISLTIQEGETVFLSTPYSLQTDWVVEHCTMVAYVQSNETQEVLQAAQCEVYGVRFDDVVVLDSGGDGDGKPDPGETVGLIVNLENKGPDATAISARLSTTDPSLTFVTDEVQYNDMSAWSPGNNSGDPFLFTVDESAQPHYADFDMTVILNGGADTVTIAFTMVIGHPNVLLVDDGTPDVDDEAFYRTPLDNSEGVIDYWNTAAYGPPGSSRLQRYEIVCWFTEEADITLSPEEQSQLASYLDNGGKLFISGENIAGDLESSSFLRNYLHAEFVADSSGDLLLSGIQGDMISDGISLISIGGVAGVNTQPDVIAPLTGAMPVFNYYALREPAAVRYGGDYKVVFFAFGFEGIIDFYDAPNSPALRADLMGNILDYLRFEFTPQIGDVNEDGNIDIIDVVWVVNIILGTHAPTSGQSWAADVNEDGAVNIVDAVVLVNIILGG